MSAPEKRIAWALLSQLSLACQPDLTEGGNVNFVPSKFRKRAVQTLRWLLNITSIPVSKEWPYSLSDLCAGLWLWLQVHPHLSLHCTPVTTGLEVIRWEKYRLMSCTWLCLKWSRFVQSQPYSLSSQPYSLSHPSFTLSSQPYSLIPANLIQK